MTADWQALRSLSPDVRPARGQLDRYGQPYVNFPDRVLGAIDEIGAPMDLTTARVFSETGIYYKNDIVFRDGRLFVAGATITPGPFNSAQWRMVVRLDDSIAVGATGAYANRLRNNTFEVWQRATTFSNQSALGVFADGWYVNPISSTVSISRTTAVRTGARTTYAMQLARTGGADIIRTFQRIESYYSAALAGYPVTFQCQFYNSAPTPMTPQFYAAYATAENNFAAETAMMSWVDLQRCPATSWTRIAYTFLVSHTAAMNGFRIVLDTGQLTNGQHCRIAECDLRATPGFPVGLCGNPPPVEYLAAEEQTRWCRRYYQPQTLANAIYSITHAPTAGNTQYWFAGFRPWMRAAPSVTTQSGFGGTINVQAITNKGCQIFVVNTGTVGMINVGGTWTANAEL